MSSELRAFELRPEYELSAIQGATVSYGSTLQMLDLKAALVDGDGRIVTGDPSVIQVLAQSELVQPGPVKEDDVATNLNVVIEEVTHAQTTQATQYIPQEPVPRESPEADDSQVVADEPAPNVGGGTEGDTPPGVDGENTPPGDEQTPPADEESNAGDLPAWAEGEESSETAESTAKPGKKSR